MISMSAVPVALIIAPDRTMTAGASPVPSSEALVMVTPASTVKVTPTRKKTWQVIVTSEDDVMSVECLRRQFDAVCAPWTSTKALNTSEAP